MDSELKCNFHIISHGQSSHLITPSFFAYHIRIILYTVPSFCKILERDLLKRSKLNAGFTVHILMIIIPFTYKVHRRMSSLTYCHTYCVLHICTLHVDFCEYRSTSKHFLVCVDHCPLRSKQRWVEGFQRRYRSDSGLKLQSKSHYVLIGWMTVLQSNKNYMESTK